MPLLNISYSNLKILEKNLNFTYLILNNQNLDFQKV